MNSITVKIASTEQELLSVYQLRYEVFYQEEGDSRYANHDLKTWMDIDDGPYSTLFIAQTPEKETVGSVRLTRLIDHDFIACSNYPIDLIADRLKENPGDIRSRICRNDRGNVKKNYRGMGIYSMLEIELEKQARNTKVDIVVGAYAKDKKSVGDLLVKQGWQLIGPIKNHNNTDFQNIYKLL